MTAAEKRIVAALLDRYGETYAHRAGIALADRPAPLYQLVVLATLLSAPITADVAVAAARELFKAGYKTPAAMSAASWQDRVDALGRGHYRRYDERTATQLGAAADLLLDRWHGDLRRLRDEAGGDGHRIRRLLTTFPGIGPVGADIFLREAQAVWPALAPYVDHKVSVGAHRLRLPSSAAQLVKLAGSVDDLVRLEAALVRLSKGKDREVQEVLGSDGA